MKKFYLYMSNNQAYHALANNSFMAKAAMTEDFRSDTVAYLSNNYVFLTPLTLPEEIRSIGIAEAYYPVAMEIGIPEERVGIPAFFALLNEDGSVTLTEKMDLGESCSMNSLVGAFVCGEIPISCLNAIVFDNEEYKKSFFKSSTDLWFPRDMEMIRPETSANDLITLEALKDAANQVDRKLTEEENNRIIRTVITRNRVKAAIYYGIEATNDWNTGAVRTNLDRELIDFLNLDQLSRASLQERVGELEVMSGVSYEEFYSVRDEVFISDSNAVSRQLFETILDFVLNGVKERKKITPEQFKELAGKCLDCAQDAEKQKILATLKKIDDYLCSNADPDETLQALGEYGVLKALMIFMDQQENSDFLMRAASKLLQKERRYAYILFGALNGMSVVERDIKCNRILEGTIEDKVCRLFPDEYLIESVAAIKSESFSAKENDEKGEAVVITGINPSAEIWFDCQSSYKRLIESNDPEIMEALYRLMMKTCKEKALLDANVYSLSEPVSINVSVAGNTLKEFIIMKKADAKVFGKGIEKIVSTLKESFDVDEFKKILADEKLYQRVYRRNVDLIQEYCRKV